MCLINYKVIAMSCNKRKRESVEADSNFLVPTEPFSDQYPKDKFTINDFKIITLDQFLDIFKGTISDGLSTYFIRYDIDGLYGDARLCAWLKINQKLYFAVFSVDNYMTEFFGENDDKKNDELSSFYMNQLKVNIFLINRIKTKRHLYTLGFKLIRKNLINLMVRCRAYAY